MAKTTIPHRRLDDKLLELLLEAPPSDLRQMLELILERVMEAEVEQRLGAEHYERTVERTGYRNGTRSRRFDTRLGTINASPSCVQAGTYRVSSKRVPAVSAL